MDYIHQLTLPQHLNKLSQRLYQRSYDIAHYRSVLELLFEARAKITCDVSEVIVNEVFEGNSGLIYKLLQCGGVPVMNNVGKSPLMAAILAGDDHLIMEFVFMNVMCQSDLFPSSEWLQSQVRSLNMIGRPRERHKKMVERMYSQPWSLETMCLVKISTCLGSPANRDMALTATGLPPYLCRKISFQPCDLDYPGLMKLWTETFGSVEEEVESGDGHGSSHVFQTHTYRQQTLCDHCGRVLYGLIRQGLRCGNCRMNIHRWCEASVHAVCY